MEQQEANAVQSLQVDTPWKEELEFKTWDGISETATFSVTNPHSELLTYQQSTTQSLRDPIDPSRTYGESSDTPRLRSGSLAFDALFALAMEEVKQNSVEEIKDGNYNNGKAIPASVFETGAKWHYVWTRDLSYAADLGLAMMDPKRVVNSLLFKTGELRPEVKRHMTGSWAQNGPQIVQDTGSGGSWPISTDRVSWAFGASKALTQLQGKDRQAFARQAFEALQNTLEVDRLAAYDPKDGLYIGEQSFLDWREQSYSKWILEDIARLGSSKALSTNAGHYRAMTLAAQLAKELQHPSAEERYEQWAQELKTSIRHHFWLEDAGLFSSLTAGHHDNAALHKFDWLGQSLAILTGIATPEQGRRILENYPHGPMGAPVIFPQQPDAFIYHNRAIWPFVTAYGLKAAAHIGNSEVANRAYETLFRGAALNLSNMENFEWLSGQPLLLDLEHPELIGPAVNSQRQLWSVGAYVGMVTEVLFGLNASSTGLTLNPYVTAKCRRQWFKASDTLSLLNLKMRNKSFDVVIHLPEPSKSKGHHGIQRITMDGQAMNRGPISWDSMSEDNRIEIFLGDVIEDHSKVTIVEGSPYSAHDPVLFAPRTPEILEVLPSNHGLSIKLKSPTRSNLTYQVYINGKSSDVIYRHTHIELRDLQLGKGYLSVVAIDPQTGYRSHHSQPYALSNRTVIPVHDDRIRSNLTVSTSGDLQAHLKDWGKPEDRFEISNIEIQHKGHYSFQLLYRNLHHRINLGITNGVKIAKLMDQQGQMMAQKVLQMPHTVQRHHQPWFSSTPMEAQLEAGTYHFVLEDYMNMSYLDSNVTFSEAGGHSGAINRIDLHGLEITEL
jgi:hypothetical protein